MKKLLVVLCVMALALPVFGETVFRIANGAEPQSLDPHMISGVPEHRIYQALFEGLMIASPATGNPGAGDGRELHGERRQKTYTFKLRKGLKWSDGVPITARTVVRFLAAQPQSRDRLAVRLAADRRHRRRGRLQRGQGRP